MSELFNAVVYKEPAVDFPAICVSLLHANDIKTVTLNEANWPTLVPALRSSKWKMNDGNEDIAYTSFTPSIVTVITLDAADSADNLSMLTNIVTSIRYYNNLDTATALTNTHYLSLNLTLNFKNNDCRILDISLVAQTITIDYDSSGLSSDSGVVSVYPHRLPSILGSTAVPENLSKAQFRKLRQETTLASGYGPGVMLTDRMQGHRHAIALNLGGTLPDHISSVNNNTAALSDSQSLGNAVTDSVNGTPRVGNTTRGNLITTYVYIFGGQYVA